MSISKTEAETEARLVNLLKESPEYLQVRTLVNMAKIGQWHLFGCGLKPWVMSKVLKECRNQGINTEQIQ